MNARPGACTRLVDGDPQEQKIWDTPTPTNSCSHGFGPQSPRTSSTPTPRRATPMARHKISLVLPQLFQASWSCSPTTSTPSPSQKLGRRHNTVPEALNAITRSPLDTNFGGIGKVQPWSRSHLRRKWSDTGLRFPRKIFRSSSIST